VIKKRVAYLMSGNAHMPYLVASLWTLRRYWDGEVVICAWPECFEIAKKIAADPRLKIADVRKREPAVRKGKSQQSMDKIQMVKSMQDEVDVVMYIDADTTIHNPIGALMDFGYEYGFAATQFCDWVTTGSKISARLKRLRDYPIIDQTMLETLIANDWPSVNSGVFAACPDSVVLDVYYEWTASAAGSLPDDKKGAGIFIADEVVLHVMQPRFVKGGFVTICGGQWNCSAKFQPESLHDDKVIVYHYHGNSNVQPEKKSQRGFDLWWPIYQDCLRRNVGGIQDWRKDISNKYLDPLENKMAELGSDSTTNWC